MGQCVSAPQDKFSEMRERSSKHFYCSKNGNLSATFHVLDSDMRWDLLNINIATEEQLMTLPGINRVTAENIVEYRQRIGGFRKVEDLALVSGVGASKLEQFRTEISVGRRKFNNGSYNSSLTGSLESLQTDNSSKSSPSKLVNLNTANVFQLMSICRMTQEMAAHIVHYRERKGPFKTVEELSKVKGLPPDRLAIVKMYLTIDSVNSNDSAVNGKLSNNLLYGRRPIGHRRTNSAPNGFDKFRNCDPSTKDFYELVSNLVIQQPRSDVFDFSYGGREVLRIASWNLQNFVIEKARNPGVQEVICRTILENGFSLIAVQEVGSKEALQLIASELNDPKLKVLKNWNSYKGHWKLCLPSSHVSSSDNTFKKSVQMGFLYDSSRGLQLHDSSVLTIPQEKLSGLSFNCQPFLGSFKFENTSFTIVVMNLGSENCAPKLLPVILEELKDRVQGKKNVFFVGDFILPPGHTVFKMFNSQGYSSLHASGEGGHIWCNSNVRTIFTGQSGVISEGLTHLAIPDGWKWGGSVSDHCPVWAEIFIKDSKTSPLSNGIGKLPSRCAELIGDSITENLINEKNKDRNKNFWERSWMWRYNHKKAVTCEKSNSKENGSL